MAMNFELEGLAVPSQSLIAKKATDRQSPKISEQIYRLGVLEGNWVADSMQDSPMIRNEWVTLCETSYRPYKSELLIRPKFEAWKQRILTQGIGAKFMIDHHGTEYYNNWTTSYDLSFKILPKGLCGPRMRQFNASNKEWLPTQDYAKVYGNLTEYGLTDFMKHKWSVENKPVWIWRTNYQDDFPKYENASSIRFLKPKASLNEADLRHLRIEPSAAYKSCPTAFKIPNTLPYTTEYKHPSNEKKICQRKKDAL